MNDYLENIIAANYKQYGLYDVNILETSSNSTDMCVFLDLHHRRMGSHSHGYSKRIFYDYIPETEIKELLFYFAYDTGREILDKKQVMNEKGIIVIANIELKRFRHKGHIEKIYPKFITSKSKFSTNFVKFIKNKVHKNGVEKTYKELSSIEGLKISKASIYNIVKNH